MEAETHASVPDKPELMATADGQDKIDLSWMAPDANGSDITKYELQVWDRVSRTWGWMGNANAVLRLSGTTTSYEHDDLTAGTLYVYRLRAVNRAPTNNGEGAWSTIVLMRTAAADE